MQEHRPRGPFPQHPTSPSSRDSLPQCGVQDIGGPPALLHIAILGAFPITQHSYEEPLPEQLSPLSSLLRSHGSLRNLSGEGISFGPILLGRVGKSTIHLFPPMQQGSGRPQSAGWPVSGLQSHRGAGVGVRILSTTLAPYSYPLGRTQPIGWH